MVFKAKDASATWQIDNEKPTNLSVKVATQDFFFEEEVLAEVDSEICKRIWSYTAALLHDVWDTVTITKSSDGIVIRGEHGKSFGQFTKVPDGKFNDTTFFHITIEYHNDQGAVADREYYIEAK